MKTFLSYWSGGYRKQPSEFIVNCHKLSVLLAKKHYGEVILLTDSFGKEIFKDCGFSNIEVLEKLDSLKVEYSKTWSISKIIAYEHILKYNSQFLHIDYDVFLFKRLPSRLERAEIFTQSPEKNIFEYYEMEKFYKSCPVHKQLEHFPEITNNASNFGIFGGKNLDLVKKYVDAAYEIFYEPENYKFWIDEKKIFEWDCRRSTILEQYLFNVVAQKNNVKVEYLFEGWPNQEQAENTGYTHLLLGKDDMRVKKWVEDVLEKRKEKKDFIEFNRSNKSPVIISFSSTGLPEEEVAEFEWASTILEIDNVNLICLRDRNKMFYHKGVYNFSNSIEDTANKLKTILDEKYKNCKVVCIGMCGGAYAALVIGSLIKADHIFVTSPRTFVCSDEEIGYWSAKNRGLTEKDFDMRYSQVCNLNFPPDTKITSLVSTDDKEYFHHSEKILKMPNVTTKIFNNLGHGMGGYLKYSGEFKMILEDIITRKL